MYPPHPPTPDYRACVVWKARRQRTGKSCFPQAEAGAGISGLHMADVEVQSPGISPQMDSPMKDINWSSEQESGSIARAVPSRGKNCTLEIRSESTGTPAPALDKHSGQCKPALAPLSSLCSNHSFFFTLPLLCVLSPSPACSVSLLDPRVLENCGLWGNLDQSIREWQQPCC